jgi:hypothetical protein
MFYHESSYLVVLSVQFDGGERGDLGVLQLVGGGVDLGDHHIIVLFEVLTELVVDRHQLFAMSTPGTDIEELGNNRPICSE